MTSCFFIGHRDAPERLHPLLDEAMERHIIKYVSHAYYDECMLDRNHRLVDVVGQWNLFSKEQFCLFCPPYRSDAPTPW